MTTLRSALYVSVLIWSAFLTGCAAPGLRVTFTSDPPGAVLYQGKNNFGYTPQTLEYNISPEDQKRGLVRLIGVSVKWASGATAEVSPIDANLSMGNIHQFNFARPDNVPGRDIDMRFALELEKLRVAQQQANAQRSAALMKYGADLMRQEQERQQNLLNVSRPINCNSTVYGNQISTNCN